MTSEDFVTFGRSGSMKICTRALCLAGLASLFVTLAAAQGAFDVYAGVGGITDKSSGQAIDTFGTGHALNSPAMNGPTLNLGASIFPTKQFGMGGEFSLRPGKGDYAGLQYRPIFYDFNGIWRPPVKAKRIVPELQAGVGGVNVRFYLPQTCDAFAGCTSYNSYLESSNHFQVHFGAGVGIYLTSSIFVRPQFDLHWVHNFFQFGSNLVPQYGAVIGYTFGGH